MSIDLGYFISRVMRFYSMNYRDVLDLPLKAFWMLDRNISRIKAEDDLRQVRLSALASSGSKEALENFMTELSDEVGKPIQQDQSVMEPGAMDRLKSLMGAPNGQR